MKNRLLLIFYIIGGVGLLFYAYRVYTINPAETGTFLKCPVHWSTGYKCPGCGSQRAVHSLMHGDIATAFHWNALLVLSIPYITLGFAAKKLERLKKLYYTTTATWIILAVIILYTVIRNTSLYPLH